MQTHSDSVVYFEFHSFVDFVMIFAQNEMLLIWISFRTIDKSIGSRKYRTHRMNLILSHIVYYHCHCRCRCHCSLNVMHLHFGRKLLLLCNENCEFSLWIWAFPTARRPDSVSYYRILTMPKTCVCPSCLMNHFVQLVTHARHCRIFTWLSHKGTYIQIFFCSLSNGISI